MPEGFKYTPEDAYKGDFDSSVLNPDFQKELAVEQLDEDNITEESKDYQAESQVFNKDEEDRKLVAQIKQLFTGKEMPYTYKQTTLEDYVNEFMVARYEMANILEKLKDKIDSGYYTSLIGDDSSGRIPGYIMFRAIGKINMAQGRKPLKITFLAGGKSVEDRVWRDIERGVGIMKDDIGEHPLLITDRISMAYTAFHYARAFKQNDLDLEIAAMESCYDQLPEKVRYQDMEKEEMVDLDLIGKEIVSGLGVTPDQEELPEEYRHKTHAFYQMTELSGRIKNIYNTWPRKSKKHGWVPGFSEKRVFSGRWNDVSLVNEGTEASRLIADVLAREYLSQQLANGESSSTNPNKSISTDLDYLKKHLVPNQPDIEESSISEDFDNFEIKDKDEITITKKGYTLEISYSSLNVELNETSSRLRRILSNNISGWRVLNNFVLRMDSFHSELNMNQLLPEGYKILFNTSEPQECSQLLSGSREKYVILGGNPVKTENILILLHEIGHTKQEPEKSEPSQNSLQSLLEGNIKTESEQEHKIRVNADALREERNAWSFTLKTIRPFLRKDEESVGCLSRKAVNQIINRGLIGHGEQIQEELEEELEEY